MEVKRSKKAAKKIRKLKAHPKDRELFIKITRQAKNSSRRLASRNTNSEELNLHELLETAHDKHRILSLLRYNENKIQFNRNKNYKKKLENEKSLRRKLKKKSNKSQNDSKKNKFKVHREGLPEVEDGKSFDNAVRVLKNPPQEMREAKTDLSRKIPPTPKV